MYIALVFADSCRQLLCVWREDGLQCLPQYSPGSVASVAADAPRLGIRVSGMANAPGTQPFCDRQSDGAI